MDRTMTICWTLRNGTVCHERILPTELPDRIKGLYRRRLKAVAWLDGQRDDPSGVVEKNSAGKWMWWYYGPDCEPQPVGTLEE